MKPRLFAVLFVVLPATLSVSAQSARPVPPGIHRAEDADTRAQQNIPPPAKSRTVTDPAELMRDADELAALAQSLPAAVNQTTHGMLPKDLAANLKRIEKLAKRLRTEVSR